MDRKIDREKEIWIERQIEKKKDGQKDRQRERKMDRKIDREKDRQRERQIERKIDRKKEIWIEKIEKLVLTEIKLIFFRQKDNKHVSGIKKNLWGGDFTLQICNNIPNKSNDLNL